MQLFLNTGTILSIDKRMSDESDMNARAALYSKDSTPMNTPTIVPETPTAVHDNETRNDVAAALDALVVDCIIDDVKAVEVLATYDRQWNAAAGDIARCDLYCLWITNLSSFHMLTMQGRRANAARLDALIAAGMVV